MINVSVDDFIDEDEEEVEVKEDKGFQQMMELQGIFTLNPVINIPPTN